MTGYGSVASESGTFKASVTVRSLNHRYLDVTVHLPRRLQGLEPDVKRLVQERISRGRVEMALQATLPREEEDVVVTARPVIGGLVRALRQIQVEHALAGEVAVGDVVRFPGALEVLESPSGLDDERRAALLGLVSRALDGLQAMRDAEGAHLRDDLGAVLAAVDEAAGRIAARTQEGQAARRESLTEKVRAACQDLSLDEPRLYQEVVRLVDRHDVAEEVQRLRSHAAQARQALDSEGPSGKRLDFLAQEMAREANTVGSKAASAEVVQEVVALKTEIERLREQVQNVE
ncbi:MAG TPA: YicC/YloC family endoribonuclease [Vicinamibacteria bacterium]|nr:YicC/YloC family endoribonuclease [Vicinamibacteria bacterium]